MRANRAMPERLVDGQILRQCRKCGQEKPLEEFTPSKACHRGRMSVCKACRAAQQRITAKSPARKEHARLYGRIYGEKHPGYYANRERAKRRERQKTIKAIKRASIARHPEKVRARDLAKAAYRKGLLARPRLCQSCGEPCAPEMHHPDYSQPYLVEWLCRPCHGLRHRMEAANG